MVQADERPPERGEGAMDVLASATLQAPRQSPAPGSPHVILAGQCCHSSPVLSTNKTPVHAARAGTAALGPGPLRCQQSRNKHLMVARRHKPGTHLRPVPSYLGPRLCQALRENVTAQTASAHNFWLRRRHRALALQGLSVQGGFPVVQMIVWVMPTAERTVILARQQRQAQDSCTA